MSKEAKRADMLDAVLIGSAALAEYAGMTTEEAAENMAAVPGFTTAEVLAATIEDLEAMNMEVFAGEDVPDGSGGWKIADDGCADWAVNKIAEERAELARMEELAEAQIARIEEKLAAARKRCENGTRFLTGKLAEYFATVPHKKTKTQETYRLLSGTLKMKLGGVSMKQDDAKLLEFLKASGQSEYIKVTESPKWGDFKKRLVIQGADVVDAETGELVEGVQLIEKPDTFTVDI